VIGGRGLVGVVLLSLAAGLVGAGGAQAVTLRPGDLLVSFSEPPASVVRFDPRTGAAATIASGDHIKDPWQLAITPAGRVLVADFVDQSIVSIAPRMGAQTVVSTTPGFRPLGLAIAPGGKLVATDYNSGEILSIAPRTGTQTPISTGGMLDNPSELSVGRSGRIFVADEGANAGVYAINPGTGAQTPLVTAAANPTLELPHGLEPTARGRLLIADNDAFADDLGGIFSLPPTAGALATISSGQLFEDPYSVARSFRGPLFVADFSAGVDGSLFRVNPATGSQTLLAEAAPAFAFPGAVEVVPPRCVGRFATIVGGPKGDVLKGTRFPDVIAGAGGADRISGRGGKDRICGGKGRDRLRGGAGRDRLRGGPGRDFTRQ
jgi:DNA-binding beta-propeller fold protein YncE